MEQAVKAGIIQKKRDFSLDCIKALAIFLVCQIHYHHYNDSFLNHFISIASGMGVPLFFMVNGALLMNKPLDVEKHYKKTARIFCMCFIWKLISVICISAFWGENILTNGWSELLNYLLGKNELGTYELGHFWYLYALIGVYTVFPMIKACYDDEKTKKIVWYVVGIIFCFSFGITTLNQLLQIAEWILHRNVAFSFTWLDSYYIFGDYGYCIVWFCLGGILYPWLLKQRKNSCHLIRPMLCLFTFGWITLYCLYRFQNIVGVAVYITNDGYYSIPTLLMSTGLFSLFVLSLHKYKSRIVTAVSKNTWGIYMLHMMVGTAFLSIQFRYQFPTGLLLNFLKSIWMIAGSMALTVIMKKIPLVKRLVLF